MRSESPAAWAAPGLSWPHHSPGHNRAIAIPSPCKRQVSRLGCHAGGPSPSPWPARALDRHPVTLQRGALHLRERSAERRTSPTLPAGAPAPASSGSAARPPLSASRQAGRRGQLCHRRRPPAVAVGAPGFEVRASPGPALLTRHPWCLLLPLPLPCRLRPPPPPAPRPLQPPSRHGAQRQAERERAAE